MPVPVGGEASSGVGALIYAHHRPGAPASSRVPRKTIPGHSDKLERIAARNIRQTAGFRKTKGQRNMKLRQWAAVSTGLALSTAHFTPVLAASFMGLGALPGTAFQSEATGVSADGSVVVGMSTAVLGNEAFRWTAATGILGLGDLPGGGFFSQAKGVSADGKAVVGWSDSDTVLNLEAFRWTQATGMVGMGKLTLPGERLTSFANGVSLDGGVVAGGSESTVVGEAIRWTQATGMTGLGDLPGGSSNSQAQAISLDGGIVVGLGNSSSGREAFRWTATTGMAGLGDLPGGDFNSYAEGVSADGSVVVGAGWSSMGPEAFRWTTATGMVGLGDLPGGNFESAARGVSADGSVVVGYSSIGVTAPFSAPFRWDITNGMQNLEELLIAQGVDLAGWQLLDASAVSADGSIIVGTGNNPAGFQEAWIADLNTIPATQVVASVLPSARSVQVGDTATSFATVINAASVMATDCGITPLASVPVDFAYQTTDPTTNDLTGTPDTPVDIAGGGFQTFVFAFTPTSPFIPTDMLLIFDCANSAPVRVLQGVNTLLLSASSTPVPDIIAVVATPSGDGIVNLPGSLGANAFAVATANVGTGGTITATADTGGAPLPVILFLCESNPATGECLSAPATSVTTSINAGATPTFSVFVNGNGFVSQDLANNRIFVRFQDAGGVTRGSTSVAVQSVQSLTRGHIPAGTTCLRESQLGESSPPAAVPGAPPSVCEVQTGKHAWPFDTWETCSSTHVAATLAEAAGERLAWRPGMAGTRSWQG